MSIESELGKPQREEYPRSKKWGLNDHLDRSDPSYLLAYASEDLRADVGLRVVCRAEVGGLGLGFLVGVPRLPG